MSKNNKPTMLRKLVIGLTIIILFSLLLALFLTNRNVSIHKKLVPTPIPSQTPINQTEVTQAPTSENVRTVTAEPNEIKVDKVNIFLIGLNDEGNTGDKIGCGDSVIPVLHEVNPPTATPVEEALTQLLSMKTQYYGQSGLYNALYQSDLHLDSVNINNGNATVKISGILQLGGVCDNPRVEAQLIQTVMQLPSITTVNIYLNNKPLKEALSQK